MRSAGPELVDVLVVFVTQRDPLTDLGIDEAERAIIILQPIRAPLPGDNVDAMIARAGAAPSGEAGAGVDRLAEVGGEDGLQL